MDKVIIVGADKFGEAVADIIMSMPLGPEALVPVGFVDDDRRLTGRTVLGLPVFGAVVELSQFPHDAVVLAILDTTLRSRYGQYLHWKGERLCAPIVHPTAILARRVTLCAGSIVAAGAIIGVGCTIGQAAILDAGCVLGYNCYVDDFTYIGPGANVGHRVVVNRLAAIQAAATIMPGVRLGVDERVAQHALVAS